MNKKDFRDIARYLRSACPSVGLKAADIVVRNGSITVSGPGLEINHDDRSESWLITQKYHSIDILDGSSSMKSRLVSRLQRARPTEVVRAALIEIATLSVDAVMAELINRDYS